MNYTTIKMDKLPTIRRLPSYLHILRGLAGKGAEFVSSSHLGSLMGIDSILVRKDLEITGISGTPRVGYSVSELTRAIEEFLGWGDNRDAFLIGAGHLGSALLGYTELVRSGIKVIAAFDTCPDKVGQTVHGVRIFPAAKIPDLLRRLDVRLAILTIPPQDAQKVTDTLVSHGIQGIWNFTTVPLDVPPGVVTHSENILSGLAVLSAKMTRHAAARTRAQEVANEG